MTTENTTHRHKLIPLVTGAGRDAQNPKAVVIYCVRPPTDNELRDIHDAAREVTLV